MAVTPEGGSLVVTMWQDYILFPTMSEFVDEAIRYLLHAKQDHKGIVRIKFLDPMATDDPLYIIDGVATKNTAFFLSLKPADVLTVKIVKDYRKLARFGLMGKNGIVMVQTKLGDVREPLDDQSKLIEGLNRPVDFPSIDYLDGRDPYIPNFRATIHWAPSIETDANGNATVEFYCSDDVGTLSIRIDGLATGGKPFSAVHSLEVNLDSYA